MKKTILAVLIFASSPVFAISAAGHASGGHASGHTSTAHVSAPHVVTPHVEAPHVVGGHTVPPAAKPPSVKPTTVQSKEEVGKSSGYPYYNQPMVFPGGAVINKCDLAKDKDCK